MSKTYTIAAFLGSFLLFASEPMAGKMLLPLYGGTSTVWTTVLFFFMVVLFIGYTYSAWLLKRPENEQGRIHAYTLFTAGIAIILSGYLGTPDLSSPALTISVWLAARMGIAAFALSTTSTLLQGWYGSGKTGSPYSLYAVSNIGSLTALLSYPFVIEPSLSIPTQVTAWKVGFCIYFIVMVGIIHGRWNRKPKQESHDDTGPTRGLRQMLIWVTLSTITNGILIATTTHLTQDIAPIPLIWITPLVLYLVSYILPFGKSWSPSGFPFYLMLIPAALFVLTPEKMMDYLAVGVGLELSMIFGLFLALHTALYGTKPPRKYLGSYYTMISLGGCIAGLLCAFIAPRYLPNIAEFPLLIVSGLIAVGIIMVRIAEDVRQKVTYTLIASGIVLIFFSQKISGILTVQESVLAQSRNFYGQVTVGGSEDISEGGMREMANGKITHGAQEFGAAKENIPLTYYTQDSGVGITITKHLKRIKGESLRIGGIGLGVGTIASYCNSGDTIRFYEINPTVVTYAETYFTYLSLCRDRGGTVEIVQGDARIELEQEKAAGETQNFDVLVVDAFTGDSIPFHLMTREALRTYLAHLADDGIVAYHISNKYMDYLPQLNAQTQAEQLFIAEYQSGGSGWVMMTRKELDEPLIFSRKLNGVQSERTWTDDYSNILSALKWKE